ncbi:hypothetical protein OHA27_38085 [Streptomyces sp. NBC_01619]|uniref:hypothetical protein n=1 Tax=Streptomyces sp. NBC_01619 TaxID=2975901 RepID=UPI00224E58E2|nr:hypothetical protein [Streptomyces sp. NBC_01619]MCX4515930.1 hypothetical protein [Streptomyces sp. NBC_01619]
MRRFDRGTLRSAGFVALLVVVFLTVNTSVAQAADAGGPAEASGLLAPLNVTTSEGAPLSGYELSADSGGALNVTGQIQSLLLGGLFTLVRLLVGLVCWLIEFAFGFPLITALLAPAQKVADAYNTHVVGALGLKGLLLGWAFIFGLILFMRGKVGKGLGEIVLTLVIAALAASAFLRPDYLLAKDGPLDQTHQAALEVASITTSSYFGKSAAPADDPCDLIVGPANDRCSSSEAQAKAVARPLQDALTNALVVKPYMLLQYGQALDPKSADDKDAYKVHLKWVKGDSEKKGPKRGSDEDPCRLVRGPAYDYCASGDVPSKRMPGSSNPLDGIETPEQKRFNAFTTELEEAGGTGEAAAAYARKASWDRVGAVVLLLIAVAVIALLVVSTTLVLLGTQGADVGAAAVGGIAWVWGMLPGPSRMAVWRWIGIYIVSAMVMFVTAMALPFFGIVVDVLLTGNGPDLMVERLLLLDAVAITFLALHRRMLAATSQFGQRLAMRMRFAKVGGTHLPGDTSELGAALAMNLPGGGGIGSPGLLGGPSGAHTALGVRHRILGSLAAMTDGAGMPFDPGRLLGEAVAEGRRGLAPLALGAAGARLALRGAHSALIGPRPPEEDESVKLLRAIAHGEGGGSDGTGPGGKGPLRVNARTGEILHDPGTDRPLLGSRIHARASRFRGYRIASRAVRIGYGATLGLPGNVKAGRRKASEYTEDAQTQLKVAANRVREDAGEWASAGRAIGHGIDDVSQRVATAWQVHDPAGRARTAARDAAAGALIFTSTPSADAPRGGGDRAASRREDPETDARRRVFDALMRAQRTSWDSKPRWGGEDE